MKYKLAIFDMDGTVLDTLDDLMNSLNYALGEFDYPLRTRDETRSFVGNGIGKLLERGAPAGTSATELERLHEVFSEHYKVHCLDMTRPYDGILPLLQALREEGYLTAVVSNKDDYAVQLLCNRFFDGLFDFAAGNCDTVRRKPHPDLVNAALKQLNVARSEAVYMGDSEVDVATAGNAEIPCIAVLWGFRERGFLEQNGAKTFAASPREIYDLLLR